jgi:hypothetical protein
MLFTWFWTIKDKREIKKKYIKDFNNLFRGILKLNFALKIKAKRTPDKKPKKFIIKLSFI